jgi:hypothetical protein
LPLQKLALLFVSHFCSSRRDHLIDSGKATVVLYKVKMMILKTLLVDGLFRMVRPPDPDDSTPALSNQPLSTVEVQSLYHDEHGVFDEYGRT